MFVVLVVFYKFILCNPVQGQYRARTGFSLCSKFSLGKTCFHYREPLFSLQGPCIHYREFPVRISTQGNPCSHYREWVCSVDIITLNCPISKSTFLHCFTTKRWFFGMSFLLTSHAVDQISINYDRHRRRNRRCK